MPFAILAYAVAALALLLSVLAYGGYVHDLGFPDGFVSELGAAERRLALAFIALGGAVAAALVVLAAWPSGRRSRSAILALMGLYAAAIAGTAVVDGVLRSTLMGGGGG